MDSIYEGWHMLDSLYNTVRAATTLAFVIGLVAILLVYAYRCYIIMCTGQKTGLSGELKWMAFVPAARWVYYLKMLNRPWWQVFFFGNVGAVCLSALTGVLFAVLPRTPVIAIIVGGLYGLFVLYFTLMFMAELYGNFGFNKLIVFCGFTPILDTLIAFSDRIAFANSEEAATGMLIGLSGTYAGQEYELNSGAPVAIGRDPTVCNIVFPDNAVNVSRHHCDICYCADDGMYSITDYSKNGTFVDGVRLTPEFEKKCYPKSVVSLGDENDRFRLK